MQKELCLNYLLGSRKYTAQSGSHGFRYESACHNRQLRAILQNSSDEEYLKDTEEKDIEEINVQIRDEIDDGTEASALQGKEDSEKE
jgi:hypothetical protein